MSSNKYADLPDIDTAPDIYETEDIFPSSHPNDGGSSDEDVAIARPTVKGRTDPNIKDELDLSNLLATEEARKKFRKAERRRDLNRNLYVYPHSPTSPPSPIGGMSVKSRNPPLSQRLRALQYELAALEEELSDPSNPLLQRERDEENVDPGELIRGLVDVRGRLEKIRKGKEGRSRLVGVVLGDAGSVEQVEQDNENQHIEHTKLNGDRKTTSPSLHSVVEMDRRVGELEKLVGTSSAALDEISPLPSPLLPLITRLNSQLTLLTQPRHIDSISRRLKLLLSDLDRASTSQHHRRHPSQSITTPQPSPLSEQLLPLLSRLGPSLPHIPHILARLRTLSTLHTAAADFQNSLRDLEQEQKKTRSALEELEEAVGTIEKSMEDNRGVVRGNVTGLETRVSLLLQRLKDAQLA